MTATVPPGLDVRYGRTPRRRALIRLWIVGVAAGLLAAGALWVVWVGLVAPNPAIDQRDLGYSLAPDSATVRYEVTATPGRTIGCAVAAKSDTSAIIGWKVVSWPASAQRTRQFSTTVRTSQPPASGLISRCWLT
ncbi:MAG: DUF4307 domain-containing protein [Micrococcales bacterium]|nr:DUF4307 domain-containing protein [Micrococcales bacterium]